MPPLPTITNVYRVAMEWSPVGGIRPVNVFHVRTTGTVADIQAAFAANDGSDLFAAVSSSFVMPALKITKLDGTSSAIIEDIPDLHGEGSGEYIPNQAMIVSLATGHRGPRGRGRMYLGPISENVVSLGLIDTGVIATAASAWNALHTGMTAHSPSVELGVASYVHADFNPVTSITIRRVAGSQRPRLDAIR